MKPILRWAGSKAQILNVLKSYWEPTYKRYVEPFCGSASLFFSLEPNSAVLSDLNEDLIVALRQIQLAPSRVIECVRRHPVSEAHYYKVREMTPSELSPVEQAARFFYLNALCFNGLYRTNKKGQFNVPYGSRTKRIIFDDNIVMEASRLLLGAELTSCDFEKTVLNTQPGDFLYLDPPYVTGDAKIFTQYNGEVFSHRDLDRLLGAVESVANQGVNFVLSYANVSEVREFGKRWNTRVVTTRRNIAGFSDNRRTAEEVLVTNCG